MTANSNASADSSAGEQSVDDLLAAAAAEDETLQHTPATSSAPPKPPTAGELAAAKKKAAAVKAAEEASAAKAAGISIHILEDGFTFGGRVWYRGEEFTAAPGTSQYAEVSLPNGKTVFDIDDNEQYNRWGKKMFGQGPWPFGGYETKPRMDPTLVDPSTKKQIEMTPAEIAMLEAANQRRGLAPSS